MDEKIKEQADRIVEKVRELIKDGNVSRVILKRKGQTLLNLPMSYGVLGAAIGLYMAPLTVLTTALVSFGLDCEVEIERKDGTTLNLSETAVGSRLEGLKQLAKDRFGKKEYPDAYDDYHAEHGDDDPFSYPGSDYTDVDL